MSQVGRVCQKDVSIRSVDKIIKNGRQRVNAWRSSQIQTWIYTNQIKVITNMV